jgi:hypothetical protein
MIMSGQREDPITWHNEGAKNARVEFGLERRVSGKSNRSRKKGSTLG